MKNHKMTEELHKQQELFNCVNSIKLLKCSQCANFETHNLTHLREHFEAGHTPLHLEGKVYNCENCCFQTHSKYLIVRHELLKLCLRNGKYKSVEIEVVSTEHTANLETHDLADHTNPSKIWLTCAQCFFKTPNESVLRRHMDFQHFNKKSFKCDHCSFETKFKHSLNGHVLTKHTKPEKLQWFECAQCSHKTKTKSALNKHLNYKHGNKEYLKCDHCCFETVFKNSLEDHISLTHTESAQCSHKSETKSVPNKHTNIKPGIQWFSTYSLEEKSRIKSLGRPMPNLDLKQQQKGRIRRFNPSLYEKNNWLCGCEVVQAVFCFPCALFGGDTTWTKSGVTDLGHIHKKISVHEKSKLHMNNVFSYSLLGKSNILSQLSTDYRQTIAAHNVQVDKNRYILNIIINCIRFCGAFELAIRGHHDDSEETLNNGMFRGLIDFGAELDRDLREHFNKAPVFEGTSKAIQNELLECMLNVYHEEVASEIKKSDYVAVIADETTNVSNQLQLVIVLRYIASGRPVERFWNFVNPTGRNSISIADSILKEIDHLFSGTPEKLIAQSYDGASVMSGVLNGVQTIIKERYPRANHVHCYAHQVNLIMSSASAVNKSVKIFFAHLAGICSFFSTSTQRTKVLDEIVNRRLPGSSQTKWDFQSRGVNTVYEYRKELITVMEAIENDDDIKLQSTIEQAGAYKLRLRDRDFIFWLTIFHKIMPHVETIFEQLQTKNTDPIKAKQYLEFFEKQIQEIHDQMDDLIEELELNLLEDEDETPPRKKPLLAPSSSNGKKLEALKVCVTIMQQIRIRFSFTGHLMAASLFEIEKFSDYRRRFPDDLLCEVVKKYPFLEKNKLKTELMVLFERKELQVVSGAISFLTLVAQDEARCTFENTLKLLEILITTLMCTSETERCFSMLKRIKTFRRKCLKEESCLGALGMLSVQKSFLNNIENFNKRVVDMFANKEERRMDFIYRSD